MDKDADFSKLTKKRRVNSRRKGNTFENQVCKLLNEHFGTKDFQRSPGSGAFATTHTLPEHLQIYGDLITPKDFKFCIECKKGYNKFFVGDFFKENSDVWNFVSQAERDSKKSGKSSIIIWKQDNKNTLIFLKDLETQEFKELLNNPSIAYIKYTNLYIFKLEDILTYTTRSFWFN